MRRTARFPRGWPLATSGPGLLLLLGLLLGAGCGGSPERRGVSALGVPAPTVAPTPLAPRAPVPPATRPPASPAPPPPAPAATRAVAPPTRAAVPPTRRPGPPPERRLWVDLTPPHQCLEVPWGDSEASIRTFFEAHEVPLHGVRVTPRPSACPECTCAYPSRLRIHVAAVDRQRVMALIPWPPRRPPPPRTPRPRPRPRPAPTPTPPPAPRPPRLDTWVYRDVSGGRQCASELLTLDGSPAPATATGPAPEVWQQPLLDARVLVLETRELPRAVCEACDCPAWAVRRLVRLPTASLAEAERLGYLEAPEAVRAEAGLPR